jgi:hypothetical protein
MFLKARYDDFGVGEDSIDCESGIVINGRDDWFPWLGWDNSIHGECCCRMKGQSYDF